MSPEVKPNTYGQLMCNKGGKNIQWGKDTLFNKWSWELWTATCKGVKLTFSHSIYKNKLKMNLRPKCKTIKLLEENIGRTLFDINCSNIFWICLLKETKTKINKWDLIKLKCFCTA